MAASHAPTDLNMPSSSFTIIDYENDIGPIVAAKCASCHQAVGNTPAPGGLDLTAVADTAMRGQIFPRGYINLSGESRKLATQEVNPPFPRRSRLIDYVLALNSRSGSGFHPTGADSLTAAERRQFNLWVLLGAQYK
jgi:hypothetical protein